MLEDNGLKEVFVVSNKVYIVFHKPTEEVGLTVDDLQELLLLLVGE